MRAVRNDAARLPLLPLGAWRRQEETRLAPLSGVMRRRAQVWEAGCRNASDARAEQAAGRIFDEEIDGDRNQADADEVGGDDGVNVGRVAEAHAEGEGDYGDGVEEIEAVAGFAEEEEGSGAERASPGGLGGETEDEQGEDGREQAGVEDGVRDDVAGGDGEDQKAGGGEDGPGAAAAGELEEECAGAHAEEELGEADERVELENAEPGEVIALAGGVEDTIGVEQDVAAGEDEAGEPGGGDPEWETVAAELLEQAHGEGEDEIEDDFDREAPGDGVPEEEDVGKPGLQ